MPKSFHRGFAPILLILLIAAALVGAVTYFKSKKPTPTTPQTESRPLTLQSPKPSSQATVDTSNWKTYANLKYEFSFIYPKDYIIAEGPNSVFVYPANKMLQYGSSQYLEITPLDRDYQTVVQETINLVENQKNRGKTIDKQSKKTIITFEPDTPLPDGQPKYESFTILDGNKSAIQTRYWRVPKDEASIYDQILSKFKFVSPTSGQYLAIDTSNWKKYTNSKYKFSMLVPPEMQHKFDEDVNKNNTGGIVSLDEDFFHQGEIMMCCGYAGPNLNLLIFPTKGNENEVDYGSRSVGPDSTISYITVEGNKVKKVFNYPIGNSSVGPVIKDGYAYNFEIWAGGGNDEANFNNLYKMVSTFKFTQ